MSTLAERIQEVLDAGFTQVDLAKAAGVTKGSPNQWLSGGIKSLKLEYALGIEHLTGFNAGWLVTGTGAKKRGSTEAANISAGPSGAPGLGTISVAALDEESQNPDALQIRRVKLKLSAGINGFAVEPDFDEDNPIWFRRQWLEHRGYYPERLIALRVKGQSMEPGLYEGDTVVINTLDTKPKDGAVYAVNYEGEAVIKRLIREIGFWWLVSDNQDQRRFPKKRCEGDACLIIGRVIHKQSEQI